jgi:hypothetical protein
VDSVNFPSFLSYSGRIENSGLKLMNFWNVLQPFQKNNEYIDHLQLYIPFLGVGAVQEFTTNKKET